MKHLKKILIILALIIPFIGIMISNRWINSQVQQINRRETLLTRKPAVSTAVKPLSSAPQRPVIDPATDLLAPRVKKKALMETDKVVRTSPPAVRYEISSEQSDILVQ